MKMKGKKLTGTKKPPCPKCPYKLGLVKTLVNPCPQCEINGYQSYEWFLKQQRQGGSLKDSME